MKFRNPTGMRPPGPTMSADADRDGRIYLVWRDCRFRHTCASNDIVLSTSTDGIGWTRVRRIPIDSVNGRADYFLPAVGADPATHGASAHLGLTFYFYPDASCALADCRLHTGFVASADGGSTWSRLRVLAGPMPLTWIADTTLGRFVGDYISTSFTADGAAHPVFAAGDPPSGSAYDETIRTVVGGIPVG
jgi:hypothetical protein